MNHIYSLVFNPALGQMQVVSEHANHRRGGRAAAGSGAGVALLPAALALALAVAPLGALAQALPDGHVIRGGIDSITNPTPDTMVIDQGNHLRGVIDWATFDIDAGYTVRFEQLADAVALNRISDVNPSRIYGNLEATGTVFLVNPNGIIFGDSASINVGGLVASTLEVDGNAFLDGGDSIALTSSGVPASIENRGAIVATGTQGVTLLGGHLSNTGVISAELGSINLLGTQTATLSFGTGNRVSIAVDEALADTITGASTVVHNNGELYANGGRVYLHANVASGVLSNAVNHAGIINASGIDADGNGGVVLAGGGGGVVQSGSITSGTDALIAAEGAVSLDGDSLDVTGLTVDAGSLSLASDLELAGNLSITVADGGISQSGAWEVGGTSTLDAGNGQIILNNAGNDFQGRVNLAGHETRIRDRNALGLGDLDVGSLVVTTQSALGLGSGVIGGNLLVDSNGGSITQSPGGLQVGGTSVLDAGTGGISLGQAGNRFDGSMQLRGHAVTIASDFDLDFDTLDVASLWASSGGSVTFGGGSVNGSLGVTSGGDISQTGAITVSGVSTLVAQDGSITLADSGNYFAGAVNLDSDGAAEIASTGTLALGAVEVGSLDASSTNIVLGEDIQTGGDQRYAGAVRLAADVALASGAGDVAFEGSVDGTHALTVEAAAGAATFGGPVGTTTALASLTADAGSVSIGNRLVVFGNLALTAATGGIAQGAAWQVGGTGMLDAGADVITLTQVGNDFVGAVHLAGGDVSIQDVNALTLGALDVGTLDATSVGALSLGIGGIDGTLVAQSNNGAITQSGALDITGTSTLNAGTGSITLAGENNRFGGAVTATGNGITLVGREDLTIAGLTFQPGPGHGIRLEAGGTLTLPGQSIDTGAAGLILASNGGELATAATLRGANVSLTGADGIHLGHDVVASTVTLHSGASISQAGGVLQMDSLHVNAGGSVSLDAENQMAELGDVDVGGNFSLRNVPAISQAEETSVSIDGDASFSSGGAITLANAGNRFGGEVGLSGGAAEISAADALRLGHLAVDSLVAESQGPLNLGRGTVVGDLEATSAGDIGQSGALAVAGTSTLDAGAGAGAINLDDAGNSFDGLVVLTGGAADIVASGALQLGNLDVTSLSATGGGNLDLGQGEIRGDLRATSAGGDIGQSGALGVGGTSRLDAGGGSITLDDAGNDFLGVVDLTGDAASIVDMNALALGELEVASLEATSRGALDLGRGTVGGSLVARSDGGDIGQSGALIVGGASALSGGAGAVTLDNAGNDFGGAVSASGAGVTIVDTGGLTVGAVASSADVRIEAGGGITLEDAVSGNRIDLATDGVFVNNAGPGALDASDSWRVYLATPHDDHVFGNLDSGNVAEWNTAAFGASSAQGNRYVFAYQPTLTFRSIDVRKTYGQAIDLADAYVVSGLMDGVDGAYLADSLGNVVAGAPVLHSAGAGATATVAGGPYGTVISPGTLSVDGTAYALEFDSTGVLTVDPAALFITARNAAKTYGEGLEPTGYTVEGLVNDDAVAGADLASDGSTVTANAGNYVITVDNATGVGLENYDITYLDGVLTVDRAGLTITASDANKTYGETVGLTRYAVDGLVNNDTVTDVEVASSGSGATANVGDYVIHVDNVSGTGLANYDITYVDGVLTVGKAGLTIRAHDAYKTLGQELGLDGYTVEGLLNDDRVDDVSLSSEGTGEDTLPGSYAIIAGNATGTGMDNYSIEYVEGTLRIIGVAPSGSSLIGSEIVASLPDNARSAFPTPPDPGATMPPAGYSVEGEGLGLPPLASCETLMPRSTECARHSPR